MSCADGHSIKIPTMKYFVLWYTKPCFTIFFITVVYIRCLCSSEAKKQQHMRLIWWFISVSRLSKGFICKYKHCSESPASECVAYREFWSRNTQRFSWKKRMLRYLFPHRRYSHWNYFNLTDSLLDIYSYICFINNSFSSSTM